MISPWPRIPRQSFGAQFRATRVAAALSLRRAAKLAGLSPSFLTDVEHNRRMPSRLHMQKLAEAIGRPVTDLLQYDPREKIEELLGCLSMRPEIVAPLAKISRRVEAGTLDPQMLDRFANVAWHLIRGPSFIRHQ